MFGLSLAGSLVCEYASLTRDGRAVTWPVTPDQGRSRRRGQPVPTVRRS
jgi:hypothetical protein